MKKLLGILVLGLLLHGCATYEDTYATLTNDPHNALAHSTSTEAFGMSYKQKNIEYAVFAALATCDHYGTGCVLEKINGTRVTAKEAADWRDNFNRNKKYLTIGQGERGGFIVTSDTGERDKKTKRIVKTPKKKKSQPDDNKVVAASMGSGFFVTRAGHLVTNYHVIEGCNAVKINISGNEIRADVIAVDKTNDLAILKVEIKPSKVFPVSNEDVSLLQDVIVAGFPLGKQVSSAIKIHKGSITALAGFGDNYSNFQTDATINQGNSGGPIMNQKGNVVGVAVQLIAAEHAQNIFFGIKSSTLKTFAKANNIKFLTPNNRDMSNEDLGKFITEATVFLDCWMTIARIKQIISQEENRKAFYREHQ